MSQAPIDVLKSSEIEGELLDRAQVRSSIARRLGMDIGSAEPLERYQRWRRFDSVASALGMDGMNRLFSNGNAGLRALRDLGLGLVDRAPPLKRFFVAEAAGMTGKIPRLLRGEAI